MGLKDFLAKYDEQFKNAEANATPRGPIPEGEYVVTVSSFVPARSRNGKEMFKWELEIAEGPHKGRTVNKYNTFHTPQTLGFLKVDLHKAGLKINALSELADRMGELFGKKLIVSIKPKEGGGYQVYIEGEAGEEVERQNFMQEEVKKTTDVFGGAVKISDDDLPF